MANHAILSPSGASRWFACPGSLWMAKDEPDQSSEFAKEGTTAHALAEHCLVNKVKAENLIGMPTVVNEILVDDEMAENVQLYVDTINGIRDSMANCDVFDVEQKLEFTDLLDIRAQIDSLGTDFEVERAFGTADAILIGDGELQVHDLKYGKGVRVSAENNKQLLIYAIAAYHLYSLFFDISKVSVHIHQPRLNHYSSFDISVDDLFIFAKLLKEKAAKAYRIYVNGIEDSDEAYDVLVPGDEQCRFCKAASKCPALANYVTQTVADDFINLNEDISNQISTAETKLEFLENTELANKFKALDMIESWCKAVRTKVQSELQQGNAVPGFKLVIGRQGNRAWSSEEEAENTLKSFRLKLDEMYTRKLISPTQATKLMKDNPKRLSKLEEIISRPDGKPTVVPESDKRPAIDPADDFTDLTQEENNNES